MCCWSAAVVLASYRFARFRPPPLASSSFCAVGVNVSPATGLPQELAPGQELLAAGYFGQSFREVAAGPAVEQTRLQALAETGGRGIGSSLGCYASMGECTQAVGLRVSNTLGPLQTQRVGHTCCVAQP